MPIEQCARCNGTLTRQESGPERRRTDTGGLTKQEMCDQIADLFGVPRRRLATGSTEPAVLFDDIVEVLGLQVAGGKPERARAIAESQDIPWPEAGDSTGTRSAGGGTVSAAGLAALIRAGQRWRQKRDATP